MVQLLSICCVDFRLPLTLAHLEQGVASAASSFTLLHLMVGASKKQPACLQGLQKQS